MGGTDNIENPGPYLHRNSRKAPHLGVLSAPASFKIPASGAPLPPLPMEPRSLSREETVQAYADRLDALNALGLSGPSADPPEAQEDPAGGDADSTVSLEVSPIAFVPSRSGPFQTITVPLYPKGQERAGEEADPVRTPRWRGG